MALDNALVTDNPVSRARSFEGYSLEKLGNRLGVSKQYLSRAEHGTYAGLNRDLVRWTANVLEVSVREVDRQYTAFQSEKRRRTATNLSPQMPARKGSREPGHVIFARWRSGYWPTVIAFCKDMCVHPASIENYEDGITTFMPLQLLDAMRETRLLDPNWVDTVALPRPRITDAAETGARSAALRANNHL